ncbi:RNA polymerase sigma factor [Marinicella litoralis]|uniref:RNA polymerase sigma-70 factor (ECF subfamily) n=1 Tax=Marinicella litoralis TaxID=644220 RepID=A0A4R6XRE4_9GAMM|nr:RNA polymerase sigma factor [Marinicella litoralis]TDR20564.1 RNA polymerase sigma-70 factor (ECF subfamily) [Marinicella litoralis]
MRAKLESTATLLAKVKDGDKMARDQLCSTYLPMLKRWAHGRLPAYARDLAETDDMVQNTLIKAMNKLDSFSSLREGAFLAYLRKILLNNIRMEIRRFSNQRDLLQSHHEGDENVTGASALDQAIGNEVVEKYENALMKIPDQAREAVILRVELGYSYPEIATAIECASANAARMIVARSLYKLAENMK